MERELIAQSADRVHASLRSMYPADHAAAAKLATFDLVTVAVHNGIPNLTLAQIARDETECLAGDYDRLRAVNAELLAALEWVIDYAPTGAGAARCRAALAKAQA